MAKTNRPSHKRTPTLPAMRLTTRDKQVIWGVHCYRVMTAHQIEVLYFASKKPNTRSRRSACQRRLQHLYHHGYLARIPQPVILGEGRSVFVYALDKRGADVIADLSGVDRKDVGWKPKQNLFGPIFLEHLLITKDVRTVIDLLVGYGVFEKMAWIDEQTLNAAEYQNKLPTHTEKNKTKRIIPDGFFSVWMPNHEKPASFFLEVDQGTTTNALWIEKVRAYQSFRNSGKSLGYFGTTHFRILAVVKSPGRLQNLKKATAQYQGAQFFWFTTSNQVNVWQPQRFVEAIWEVAGEEGVHTLFTA